jgi:hypothetical protein
MRTFTLHRHDTLLSLMADKARSFWLGIEQCMTQGKTARILLGPVDEKKGKGALLTLPSVKSVQQNRRGTPVVLELKQENQFKRTVLKRLNSAHFRRLKPRKRLSTIDNTCCISFVSARPFRTRAERATEQKAVRFSILDRWCFQA